MFRRVVQLVDETTYDLLLVVDGLVLAVIELMCVFKDEDTSDGVVYLTGDGVVGHFSKIGQPDAVLGQHAEGVIDFRQILDTTGFPGAGIPDEYCVHRGQILLQP